MSHSSIEQPEPPLSMNRRALAGKLGVGALSVAAISAGLSLDIKPAMAQTLDDNAILNFALNLEYLEAEYYRRAHIGQGLPDADVTGTGFLGGVIGGNGPVSFSNPAIAQYAGVIAATELAHVRVLRAALGANAVARPAINLQSSFTTAALAAGLISPGQTFNPFADDVSFLLGASIFEDLGVTAYAGAARFITNKDYLEVAGAILAVEGYHAGAVRSLLANMGAGAAFNRIAGARRALSGQPDEEPLVLPNNAYNFVPTDANGLVYRRTPQQVLNIAYLGGQASNFGFFPNGVNGPVQMS